jgi:hypothetical protein
MQHFQWRFLLPACQLARYIKKRSCVGQVGADPEVQTLRHKATTGKRMKNVPALYVVTAMALEGMSGRANLA